MLPYLLVCGESRLKSRRYRKCYVVPVTPLTLTGTRHVLTPHDRRPRRGTVGVTLHPPVRARTTDWAGAVALRDDVRSLMNTTLTRDTR